MSARLCIQRLTTRRCPQQRVFKSILRTYSATGSPLLSGEHLRHTNKQLSVNTIVRQHGTFQRVLNTVYIDLAHSRNLYSSDSKSTSEQNASKSGGEAEPRHRDAEREPLPEWPDGINPHTGEKGGPRGPEPTRYGDWERKGRVSDF